MFSLQHWLNGLRREGNTLLDLSLYTVTLLHLCTMFLNRSTSCYILYTERNISDFQLY